MHLVCCLFLFEAWFQFEFTVPYISGVENSLVDDLSQDRLSRFLHKVSEQEASPSNVKQGLPDLLLEEQGWILPSWTTRFISTVTED